MKLSQGTHQIQKQIITETKFLKDILTANMQKYCQTPIILKNLKKQKIKLTVYIKVLIQLIKLKITIKQ